jgi:hypothetical protein
VFWFAFDVAAAGAAVAVDRGQVLPGHRVENEDRPLQATITISSLITGRNVAATEVDEEGFTAMMEPPVGEHIPDIVERQIPLCQASPGVLRNHSDSRFSHRFGPPHCLA